MAIPYEAFNGREAGHFMYARGLGGAAAVEVLERRLRDGSWRSAVGEWVELLKWCAWKEPAEHDRIGQVATDFAATLTALPHRELFTDEHAAMLKELVPWLREHFRDVVRILIDGLLPKLTPGEAGIVADVLQQPIVRLDGWVPPLRLLGEWLVSRGAAELRNPQRVQLLLYLTLTIENPAPLAAAMRLLVRDGPKFEIQEDSAEKAFIAFWDRVERFDEAGPDEVDVGDLLARMVGVGTQHRSGGMPDPDRHPRCARIMFRLWLLDTPGFGNQPFGNLALHGGPARVGSLEGLPLPAVRALVTKLRTADTRFYECPFAEAWTEAVTAAIVRAVGGLDGLARDERARFSLRMLSGWERPAAGVEVALRVASPTASGPARALVEAILNDVKMPNYFRVSAAIMSLGPTPESEPISTTEPVVLPDEYRHVLLQVLHGAPARPVYGVSADELFRGCTDVRFEHLPDELAVEFDSRTLRVDSWYPELLLKSGRSRDEQHALVAIYVVHELVHAIQNVRGKEVVRRLRETSNEQALMHFDLGADHAAAVLVAAAVPGWSLQWLKDVQGRSIMDFLSTPTHPYGSRLRKAARLVGLRLDWLVRVMRPELKIGEGYVSAGFGPAAGPFHVITSGPPPRILFEATASDKQISALMHALDQRRATDPGGGTAGEKVDPADLEPRLEGLDRVLRELIGGAAR